MAYNEIAPLIGIVFIFFICSVGAGVLVAVKVYGEMRNAYQSGFEVAKTAYKKDDDVPNLADLARENAAVSKVTPEMLMAYGVGRVGDLPKEVLEKYGISPEEYGMDLDTMLIIEEEPYRGV